MKPSFCCFGAKADGIQCIILSRQQFFRPATFYYCTQIERANILKTTLCSIWPCILAKSEKSLRYLFFVKAFYWAAIFLLSTSQSTRILYWNIQYPPYILSDCYPRYEISKCFNCGSYLLLCLEHHSTS